MLTAAFTASDQSTADKNNTSLYFQKSEAPDNISHRPTYKKHHLNMYNTLLLKG